MSLKILKIDVIPIKNLYIGMMTIPSTPNRINSSYELYGRQFIEETSKEHFITLSEPFEGNPYVNVEVPQQIRKKYDYLYQMNRGTADRRAKFFTFCEYCLSMPDCKWAHFIGDDVYINLAKYADLMKEVVTQGNPMKENLVFGNCIGKNVNFYFQGGTGYLMSRHAVREVAKLIDETTSKPKMGDDYLISSLFIELGSMIIEGELGMMEGHPFREQDLMLLEAREYSKLPLCESFNYKDYCYTEPLPLNRVALFHNSDPTSIPPPHKMMEDAPDYVYVVMAYSDPIPCLKSRQ